MPRIIGEDVTIAAGKIPIHAGRGMHAISPATLRSMPPQAAEDIANILNAAESPMDWPQQMAANRIALLAKSGPGFRTIALTPCCTGFGPR